MHKQYGRWKRPKHYRSCKHKKAQNKIKKKTTSNAEWDNNVVKIQKDHNNVKDEIRYNVKGGKMTKIKTASKIIKEIKQNLP